jgi:hypothetical protein
MVQDPTKIGIFLRWIAIEKLRMQIGSRVAKCATDHVQESKPNEAEKRNDPYLPT